MLSLFVAKINILNIIIVFACLKKFATKGSQRFRSPKLHLSGKPPIS